MDSPKQCILYRQSLISSMFSMRSFSDKSMGSLMLSILFETFFVPRNTRLNVMMGVPGIHSTCFIWRPLQICLALVIGMLMLSDLLDWKFLKKRILFYTSPCVLYAFPKVCSGLWIKAYYFKLKIILENQLATPRNCAIYFLAKRWAEDWNYDLIHISTLLNLQ